MYSKAFTKQKFHLMFCKALEKGNSVYWTPVDWRVEPKLVVFPGSGVNGWMLDSNSQM